MSKEGRDSLNLRHIETLVIKPSQDLSRIADRFYDDMPFAIKTLLKFFGINRQSDSSIVSYLLFEKSYTTTLIDLGYQDAMDRIDEIKQFFDIPTKV
jgi:NTE family protein